MVKKGYVPERGDIVRLNFDPQSGHEQRGTRPAMVISPKEYNEKVGMGLFCPITSKIKGYPFEVTVVGNKISGVVLSDQVKSLDWKTRDVVFIAKASSDVVDDVISKIAALIFE